MNWQLPPYYSFLVKTEADKLWIWTTILFIFSFSPKRNRQVCWLDVIQYYRLLAGCHTVSCPLDSYGNFLGCWRFSKGNATALFFLCFLHRTPISKISAPFTLLRRSSFPPKAIFWAVKYKFYWAEFSQCYLKYHVWCLKEGMNALVPPLQFKKKKTKPTGDMRKSVKLIGIKTPGLRNYDKRHAIN